MNIIEAVKSGKRIRRRGWQFVTNVSEYMAMKNEDILSTDWEIEEKKIEITESEFDEACQSIVGHTEGAVKMLKKRLFER